MASGAENFLRFLGGIGGGDNGATRAADAMNPVTQQRKLMTEAALGSGMLNPQQEQFLRQGGDVQALGTLNSIMGGADPAAVREYEYYQQLDPQQQKQYLGVKRAAQTIDLGGGFGAVNPTDLSVTPLADKTLPPEQLPETKREQAEASAAGAEVGKAAGEKEALLKQYESSLPELEKTIGDLSQLSETATYTQAGRITDSIIKEAGFGATEGAIDRAEFISKIDNVVLPMLKETFGAAFTVQEGDNLKATMGDPNASPAEKQAVLNSFITQKMANIRSAQRYLGKPVEGEDGGQAPVEDAEYQEYLDLKARAGR